MTRCGDTAADQANRSTGRRTYRVEVVPLSALAGTRTHDATALREGPRGERGHAHRDEGALGGWKGTDGRQELIGSGSIHGSQDRVAAMRQHDRPLPMVIGFLPAFNESAPDEAIDKPAGRRRGASKCFGQFPDGDRAPVREDVQGCQLGEPESQVTELGREPDDQLAPERPAHGDAFRDLTHVRDPRAGQDRSAQIGLEPTGDGSDRGGAGSPSSGKSV